MLTGLRSFYNFMLLSNYKVELVEKDIFKLYREDLVLFHVQFTPGRVLYTWGEREYSCP